MLIYSIYFSNSELFKYILHLKDSINCFISKVFTVLQTFDLERENIRLKTGVWNLIITRFVKVTNIL